VTWYINIFAQIKIRGIINHPNFSFTKQSFGEWILITSSDLVERQGLALSIAVDEAEMCRNNLKMEINALHEMLNVKQNVG
jgi:hypothetical protein